VNGDTVVDILDLLEFLDAFSQCEQQPGPCVPSGLSADADFNGDTTVDIIDLLEFLDAFSGLQGACPA
jgi:hypothetical protein